MNRARARRKHTAWTRYHARYRDMRISLGTNNGLAWFHRSIRRRR